MSSGVLQVFCLRFRRLRACWTGPRARAAWGRGLPCSPAAADPGERAGGSRTGRSPAGEAGAAGRP